MKTNILLFVLFALFFSANSNAQYRRNYGLDRSIGSQDRYNTPKKNKSYDFVKTSTENLVKELNLDGFQEAIVKNSFEDYKNTVAFINEEQIPSQAKYEKIQVEIDKLDIKIEELLNKEQKVKFAEFKKRNSKKKAKNDLKDIEESEQPEEKK